MSQDTAIALGAPLRICCACDKQTCSGEVVTLQSQWTRDIYVRCAPLCGPELELDFEAQARRFYSCLPRLLEQSGAKVADVVLERVFFKDFAADMEAFREIRRESYREAGVAAEDMPATTYIQQPPARDEQKIELQIHAILPGDDPTYSVQTFYDELTDTTAKLLTIGGRRHLYIADIRGLTPRDVSPHSFRQQCDLMFARCADLLARHGSKFTDVLRTWCYIKDIDRDYDQFNLSRNVFFAEHGVTRLPASTGIEAGLWPAAAGCGMDLYALLDTDDVGIEIMKTPTLNEAPEYGSAFSRGMKVNLPDKTVLYISGTASVDEFGATVHLDDIDKQLERMLVNVRELLAVHGASFEDLSQIATFLKHAEYLPLCEQKLAEWGIRHVPNTLVEAGVCRPDLLCEMEAIAILPKRKLHTAPVAAPIGTRT